MSDLAVSGPLGVLWDMDGTLLDSEKLWDIPLYEYAEKLGGTLSLETRERMVGTNVPTTMRLLFADVGIEPSAEDLVDGAAWISRRTEEVFRAGAHRVAHCDWQTVTGARGTLRITNDLVDAQFVAILSCTELGEYPPLLAAPGRNDAYRADQHRQILAARSPIRPRRPAGGAVTV